MGVVILNAELEMEVKYIKEHHKKQIKALKPTYHKEPSLSDTINYITYRHRVLQSIQYKLGKIIEETRKIECEQINKQEILKKLQELVRDDNNIIII